MSLLISDINLQLLYSDREPLREPLRNIGCGIISSADCVRFISMVLNLMQSRNRKQWFRLKSWGFQKIISYSDDVAVLSTSNNVGAKGMGLNAVFHMCAFCWSNSLVQGIQHGWDWWIQHGWDWWISWYRQATKFEYCENKLAEWVRLVYSVYSRVFGEMHFWHSARALFRFRCGMFFFWCGISELTTQQCGMIKCQPFTKYYPILGVIF